MARICASLDSKLRGAFPDTLLQRFVQPSKLALGLLGRGDVVRDADEADMLAGRDPSAAAIPIAASATRRRRAGSALPARTALARIRRRSAPCRMRGRSSGCSLLRQSNTIASSNGSRENPDRPGWRTSACGRAWSPRSAPGRCWRSAGNALRFRAASSASIWSVISICAPTRRSARPSGRARSWLRRDPSDLAVAGPDDAVLRGVFFCRSLQRIQKFDGPVAVLRMQPRDPVGWLSTASGGKP